MVCNLKWLQHSCFEPRFLHNKDLKEQIRILDNNPDTLSREQKKKIRNARHGAYKAWRKTLLGNKDLAPSIMPHGLFRLADMRDFMVAFLDDADKQREEDGAWGGEERLRREAVAARRTLKEAGKLAYMRESELTPWEKKLLQKLDSGKLEEDWQAKERAYGYGTSLPKPVSRRDAILFRVSCSEMDMYHTVDESANCFQLVSSNLAPPWESRPKIWKV